MSTAPNIMHPPAEMTDAEIEACVEWFSTLPLKELRHRQDLVNQQLKMAFDQKNERALRNLRAMETQLADGVGRWLDKKNGLVTHKVILSPGNGGVTYAYDADGHTIFETLDHGEAHQWLSINGFVGTVECLRHDCELEGTSSDG